MADDLEKMASPNVKANRPTIGEDKRAREEVGARHMGFHPRPGNQDRFGVGKDQRGLVYNPNVGTATHEVAHAVMTPVGSSLREHQRKMGQVSTPQEARGMPVDEHRREEAAAYAMEPALRRRAGLSPDRGRENGLTNDYWSQYSNGARARGLAELDAFEQGIKTIDPKGNVVPGTSVDAKINARAKVGPLAMLRQRASMSKSEGLEKTSWNVKQQRSNIGIGQANARRAQYARSIGLNPQRKPEHVVRDSIKGGTGSAEGNKLPWGGDFGLEHEAAHAAMVPPGQTIEQYQEWLSQHSQPFDEAQEYGEIDPEHEESVRHENVANAIEPHFDRRAGVDPHKYASRFRENLATPVGHEVADYPHYDHDENYAITPAPAPRSYREEARARIGQFDEGARFDEQGRIVKPDDVNAQINQRAQMPQSGRLEAMRQRAMKTKPWQLRLPFQKEEGDWRSVLPKPEADPEMGQLAIIRAKAAGTHAPGPAASHLLDRRALGLAPEAPKLQRRPGIMGNRIDTMVHDAFKKSTGGDSLCKTSPSTGGEKLWMGRPILHEDHGFELDRDAADHEFGEAKLPRSEAEERAYDGYVKRHRTAAANHHLRGMRAAQASGDKKAVERHFGLYKLHMKALGHDELDRPPADVLHHGGDEAAEVHKFRPHGGDLFAVPEIRRDQVAKAERAERLERLHKGAEMLLLKARRDEVPCVCGAYTNKEGKPWPHRFRSGKCGKREKGDVK